MLKSISAGCHAAFVAVAATVLQSLVLATLAVPAAWAQPTAALPAKGAGGAILSAMPAADASRFLHQATFGPTVASISELQRRGHSGWLAAQWAQPQSSIRALQAEARRLRGHDPHNRYLDVQTGVWAAAIEGPDQLRQRVAFALSQIFVVNVLNADPPLASYAEAAADYWDTLARHADGNYRNLLQAVALHPQMGLFLSHLANQKEEIATGRLPDQNFAREVLQLFSIGLHELNLDGSLKRNAQGNPIETYSGADVAGLAKVFTGFSFDTGSTEPDRFWGWNFYDNGMPPSARWLPMRLYAEHHSPASKRFLGLTIADGTDGHTALRMALDRIANHANVGPFLGRQLIQRLVMSNPSPAYVARVAAVFKNNGAGVRGDLKATVQAVLMDSEARSRAVAASASGGRLKEPVLRVTNFYRAVEARPGAYGWNFWWTWGDDTFGQAPFSAPSVFNYYRPGFSPAGTALAANGLVAPEMQITNEVSTLGWTHMAREMIRNQPYFASAPLALLREQALASDPKALVQHLNTVYTGGTLSGRTQELLREAVASVPAGHGGAALDRVHIALTLMLSSTDFLVQK